MGKILSHLKEEDGYKLAVGDGVETWEGFLKQPEIGLSKNEATRLIHIYDELVVRLGYSEDTVSDIPLKNIHYLLPIAKKANHKEEIDELLADATLLSQKDFKERLMDKRIEAGEPTRTYEFLVMAKTLETGTMEKVPGFASETLKEILNLYNYGQEK